MKWKQLPFKQVSEIVTGSTPPTKDKNNYGDYIPFVTPADLGENNYIIKTKTRLSKKGLEQARRVSKDSVMVTCIGSLGKVGIAGKDVVTNQQINSLTFNEEKVYPQFGYYYCTTLSKYLIHIAPSTTLPIINKSRFSNIEIPLPPLDIQKKIATVLDKADQLKKKRKKSIEKLDQLIQSVFLDMFGDPVMNPYNWKSCKLNEISEIVSGITKGRKLKIQLDLELPYMRVANVQDGYLDLSDVKTIPGTVNDIDKYGLKENDILLTEGGDPDKLGRGAIWNNEVPNCVHQNHIFRVRLTNGNITPVYFNKLCGSVYGKRYFLKSSKQTTGIASINKTQLKKFPVLLPPLELQNKFEKIILSIISKKEILTNHQRKLNNLFNSLLQQAFKGELKFNDKAFKELEKEVMN